MDKLMSFYLITLNRNLIGSYGQTCTTLPDYFSREKLIESYGQTYATLPDHFE